ncbi:hypothetical protein E3P77_03423 [Wallemia ichthyophaga]|nr:hypothetical protein E3P77_03423 [Wallemia ichthyophaga]
MISLSQVIADSLDLVVKDSIRKVNRKRRSSRGHLSSRSEKADTDVAERKRVKMEPNSEASLAPLKEYKESDRNKSKKKQTFDGTNGIDSTSKDKKTRGNDVNSSNSVTDPVLPHDAPSTLVPQSEELHKKGRKIHKGWETEPVLPEHRYTRWLYPPQIKIINDNFTKIKQGTFDEEERRIVYDWISKYKITNNLDDDQLRERIFASKKEKNRDNFWCDLTECVPHRVLASVYTHVRARWHPYANKGIWTKDEDDRLLDAHAQLGTSWTKISHIVERPANECSDHYRRMFVCPERRKGLWSEDEKNEYLSIVIPMMNERNHVTRDGHDPFWVTVQEKMGRKRSAHQCRIKWEDELRGRDLPNRRSGSDFRRSDCGILIKHVLDMNIKERGVINFKSLGMDTYKGEWSVKTLRDQWRYITYRSCGMDKELATSLPFEKLMERVKSTFRREIEGKSENDDVVADMEMDNLQALLEAESEIPPSEQIITHVDSELSLEPTRKLKDEGITADAMLGLRRKVQVAGKEVAHDGEMMRLQLLGNRDLLEQMKQVQPELAEAAEKNPPKFYELMQQAVRNKHVAETQQAEMLNSDPFDIDSQKRIEEEIRQQAVAESFERAIEYNPETFGMVEMLYIDTQVNKHHVKAFVDTGAQNTIMSPKCAEDCNLMRLLDTRFQGIARGVGTAKILGRIHAAPMQIGDILLQCSFTVTEGSGVDLLFGLDMLKRHQAVIDLRQNAMIIQDIVIPFLAEHEIPKNNHQDPAQLESAEGGGIAQQPSIPPHSGDKFPGSGATLGGSSTASQSHPAASTNTDSNRSNNGISEEKIAKLMELGVGREEAIQALRSTNGNIEYASSLLF